VLTGRGWGTGGGRVALCSMPQEPCCQGKPAQEKPDTDGAVPRELGKQTPRLLKNSRNTASHLIITARVPRVTTIISRSVQDMAVL